MPILIVVASGLFAPYTGVMTCQHSHCITTALMTAETKCAATGARLTPQRRQILTLIWQSHTALTAADIMAKTQISQPPIIYRALDFLKQQGLIHHITSLNAYIGCNHATDTRHIAMLMICTQCRIVIEQEATGLHAPLTQASTQAHFTPVTTHIEILGRCAVCV